MKSVVSTFFLFCFALIVSAQTQLSSDTTQNIVVWKNKYKKQKALGDTLYYEDFGSGGSAANQLPPGWTTQDWAGYRNDWIWTTSYVGGQYSQNVSSLNSTTASNGFLSLPSDLYNTPIGAVPNGMDATVSSPPIAITPKRSIAVQWQQHNRYCCHVGSGFGLFLQVSTDGQNWTSFPAWNGRKANETSPNAEFMSINVSSVLANQDTAYIRFYQIGPSHYFWMIDDLAIVEGVPNEHLLEGFIPVMNHGYQKQPVYSQYPAFLNPQFSFQTMVKNVSSYPQAGLKSRVEVFEDTNCLGLEVTNKIGQTIDSSNQLLQIYDTLYPYLNQGFQLNQKGTYRFVNRTSTDSFILDSHNALSYEFKASDTVIAKDYWPFDNFEFLSHPFSQSSIGGAMSTLINMPTAFEPTSLSFYPPLQNNNLGVSIKARIWSFNEAVSNLDSAINTTLLSSLPMALDSNNMGSWITLSFDTANAVLAAGQYLVGIEVTASPIYRSLVLASDCDMEEIKPMNSNYVLDQYFGPSSQWREVERQLAIRLNIKNSNNSPCTVSLDQKERRADWQIFPNPNQGNFQLSLPNPLASERVEVRNLKGQLISRLSLNGEKLQTFNHTDLDAGIYFISLIGEEYRETKKLIIR